MLALPVCAVCCLGTMTWGRQNTEAEAHEQLSYAFDNGINFMDTAEMYPIPPAGETKGLTDLYIGTWMKQRKREDIILATKVGGSSSRRGAVAAAAAGEKLLGSSRRVGTRTRWVAGRSWTSGSKHYLQ